ncbi:MAG: hypothetical protein ACYC1E_13820 [Propionibacteriaceae bacterium]
MTVILSNYFTALLAMVCGYMLMLTLFAVRRWGWGASWIVGLVVVIFSSGMGWSVFNRVISILINLTPDGKTAYRLGMLASGSASSAGALSEDRMSLLNQSLAVFARWPLFGLSIEHIPTSGGYLIGFGQHSHLLDTFALFGLGMGLLQLVILFRVFVIRNRGHGDRIVLSLPVALVAIIVLGMDNAAPAFGLVVYLIYPYVIDGVFPRSGRPEATGRRPRHCEAPHPGGLSFGRDAKRNGHVISGADGSWSNRAASGNVVRI